MALRLEEIVIDCAEPGRLGAWWQSALGWERGGDPDDDEFELVAPGGHGPSLLFVEVPEPKRVKNRVHLDWVPDEQETEVQRLVDLGATRVDVGQGDVPWVVLADPEGNEFCVLSAR